MSALTDLPSISREPKPVKPRKKGGLNEAHGRWAFYLIVPTGILLAVVIGYPVVSAVIMSFQKDAGLDKATGLFVAGGFAGVANYAHWFLQQCTTAAGTAACPRATSARSSGRPSATPSSSRS
ncbi:hypothetical protein GCM10025867_15340 [Frondihabitans sucicola]|uniref:Sugar ABC transporter permease n=1 Tax=Frondihabitans sucicola TaxID=1268041 RepID=A0ABN6XYV2_9MICO|nr:hypothetical protein GCM10025867_15340 [Frondihabitans sucicola]